MSGKTFWTFRLLQQKQDMFTSPPAKVLYCYAIFQPLFEDIEKQLTFVTFHHGVPSEDTIKDLSSPDTCNLIILDDLMENVTSSSDMEQLFVKGVHHLHLSVLYINQNLYCKGNHSRTINLNTHIYVLMKNPRDVSQLQCLARQAFLGKSAFLMEAYKDATAEPYGYLVLDFSPSTEEAYRVRAKVFIEEDTIIYQPA